MSGHRGERLPRCHFDWSSRTDVSERNGEISDRARQPISGAGIVLACDVRDFSASVEMTE